MTTRTLIIGCALAAALSATPTLAADRAAHVAYNDLDLSSADGQAELQARLDKAARKVCRFEDNGQVSTPADENACYRATRQKVDVQVAYLTSDFQRGG
ncbi:UrcA family protein [Altererythrobacter salegens]|uniref:UrcA family protein n=1 Tax=Croceibacterium salegens TaxID=1737568 RepID=A0A6I4SWX2_9SPHN|nr:UrcA family protein [Croceibacterium salegens]